MAQNNIGEQILTVAAELFAADGEYKRLYLLQSDLHQMREGT